MKPYHPMPAAARQLLPAEAYTDQSWFDREQSTLFGRGWSFVCLTSDIAAPGDYAAIRAGQHSLVIVRTRDGSIFAFHNLCRHRGTELFEPGRGNTGNMVVCPYHRWTYDLDGGLRGVPQQANCFPGLDKSSFALKPAAHGIHKDMIFIHPNPDPEEPFETWIADLPNWPHSFCDGTLTEAPRELVYEMNCNWKVFYENAIDGYHLAYLHENTLGGPPVEQNVWDAHGRHLAWYSTQTGRKTATPTFVAEALSHTDTPILPDAKGGEFPGVIMLFPTTILTPSPYSISLSILEPLAPDLTLLKVRLWSPNGGAGRYQSLDSSAALPGLDPSDGRIKLSKMDRPILEYARESGDFQMEDMWICEKMQRALSSPAYEVSQLADGAGAEAPLTFFQQNVLDFLEDRVS